MLGLVDRDHIPIEDWRLAMMVNPVLSTFWRDNKTTSFRPDFVRFMDEEVLNER